MGFRKRPQAFLGRFKRIQATESHSLANGPKNPASSSNKLSRQPLQDIPSRHLHKELIRWTTANGQSVAADLHSGRTVLFRIIPVQLRIREVQSGTKIRIGGRLFLCEMRQNVQHAPRTRGSRSADAQRTSSVCLRTLQQDFRSRSEPKPASSHPHGRAHFRVQAVWQNFQKIVHAVYPLAHSFGHPAVSLSVLR